MLHFLSRGVNRIQTSGQRFLPLTSRFFNGVLSRLRASRYLQFGLLDSATEPVGHVLRLLASVVERFRDARQLFGVLGALRETLFGKPRGQIARDLFELRYQAFRQIVLQRCRSRFVGGATPSLRFLLNLLDRPGNFLRKCFARV